MEESSAECLWLHAGPGMEGADMINISQTTLPAPIFIWREDLETLTLRPCDL